MKALVIASLFTAFIALVVYLTSIIAVHGIRKSISDTNYFLRKPYKLVFEIVMWICGLAIVTTGLFIKASVDWWVIGGGIGIFLVGIFSDFKRNIYIRIAHYVSAIGGFTLLALSFGLGFDSMEYMVIIGLSALITTSFADQRIWYLELTMSALVFAGLFYLAHTIM